MRIREGLVLGALVCLAGLSRAGVVAEWSEHDVATGKMTPKHTMSVQGNMLRMENSDGKHTVLFRDNALYMLDPATKSYHVLDKAAMDQMAGKLNDAMGAMQARLANLPPEQRAMMEKAMPGMAGGMAGGAAPAKHVFDAVEAGGSGSAAGRSCTLWNALRDGKPVDQLCVVPKSSLPGTDEVIDTIRNMAAFNAQLQDAMQAHGGPMGSIGANIGSAMSQNLAVMQKIGGVPVASRRFDASTGALAPTEMVITKWQPRDLDAALFAVPPGYTRKDMMGGR